VDSAGKPACELCGRRLADVKHHRAHGIGRACTPRCKPRGQVAPIAVAPATAAAQPAANPRKRRGADSDPGEQPAAAKRPMTRRVALPKPAPVQKQPRIARSHEEVMRLLDETVARRMAYEAATQR
jgi:hypothetical protein